MNEDEGDDEDLPESLPMSHFSLTSEEKGTLEQRLRQLYEIFESAFRYQSLADRASNPQSFSSTGTFRLDIMRHS